MKVVCVICTELLLINSHISVCSCGHLFHEECLFKWIRTGQLTCPQCRCKLKEKEIVKRLYFNEYDITSSQQTTDFKSVEVNADNFERLLNKVEELKNNAREQTEALSSKSKLIEQSEKKIKEHEQQLSNTKKNLSERQLLIDYLKKELENYAKLKDQNDSRQKTIVELELKLREYRSVEMIYKEHEATFANEMNKYLSEAVNPQLSQTIIRQLVSTNVLLKEHSDKQMEEKRLLRKKLIQIERLNTEQNRQLEKNEQELNDLRKAHDKLKTDAKLKDNEIKNLKTSSNFIINAQSTPSLNKENVLVNKNSSLTVNETIEFDDTDTSFSSKKQNITNDDSDLKYLDELNRLEAKRTTEIISLEDDVFYSPSPMIKKRKNPFVSNQDEDLQEDEIRPNQAMANKFQKFKSFNELSLSQRFKESPTIDIEIVKPIVTNNMKKSRFNEQESTSSNKAFSYLSDGLGGRAKISNSSAQTTSVVSNASKTFAKKQSFLTKFKVSNFK